MFGYQVAQSGLEAWPFPRQPPPCGYTRTLLDPQIEESKIVEACSEWHQVDVGQTRIRTQYPRSGSAERVLQHLERPLICGNAVPDERRTHAQLISGHETVAAAGVADITKAPFTDFFRHVAHALAEHRREAQLGHALEQTLVHHLAPQPHARAQPGIAGYEPRLGKRVVEVLANQCR